MAGKATAGNEGASFDEVLEQNSELAAQVNELMARVQDLTRAALMGVGIDSALAEMTAKQERKLVQFKENYARASTPSPIQPDRVLVEGYQCAAGEIVLLPVSEIKRLTDAETVKHVPGPNGKTKIEKRKIIETDESKFEGIFRHRLVAKNDPRGRLFYERESEEVSVAEIKKAARPVG